MKKTHRELFQRRKKRKIITNTVTKETQEIDLTVDENEEDGGEGLSSYNSTSSYDIDKERGQQSSGDDKELSSNISEEEQELAEITHKEFEEIKPIEHSPFKAQSVQ